MLLGSELESLPGGWPQYPEGKVEACALLSFLGSNAPETEAVQAMGPGRLDEVAA